jgi:hypothetical protein
MSAQHDGGVTRAGACRHTLRMSGITDKVHEYTQLLSKF